MHLVGNRKVSIAFASYLHRLDARKHTAGSPLHQHWGGFAGWAGGSDQYRDLGLVPVGAAFLNRSTAITEQKFTLVLIPAKVL